MTLEALAAMNPTIENLASIAIGTAWWIEERMNTFVDVG